MKKALFIIHFRSKVALCEGSLRITVGSPEENRELIEKLRNPPAP
jgi:histidinol-phosphate aminotransferase